jgi:hypothetical protein
MDVCELRIHGVGGSPGEKLIGIDHPDDAVVVGEGRDTRFLSPRRERSPEGYDWGGLTSGSLWQPLWLLLLPFTLVNVAGWAHPPFGTISRWRLGALRILVHAAAALLTIAWVVWIGIIAIDYLGYQWLGSEVAWVARLGFADPRLVGVLIGFAVTGGATLLLWFVARTSRHRFEEVRPDAAVLDPNAPERKWAREEDLTAPTFFSHESAMTKRLNWHVTLIVITLLVLVTVATASWGQPQLLLGEILVVLGAAQIGVLLALGAVSWRSGGQYEGLPARRALPAAAVTLAFALSNGFFSGAAVLAARLLPSDAPWGPELALIDGFVVTVALWILLGIGWVVVYRKRGTTVDIPPRSSPTAQELDGVDDRFRKQIAAMRGLAKASHEAPRLLVWYAAAFLIVGAIVTAIRIEPSGPPWEWLRPPEATVLVDAAAWLLPLVVLAVLGTIWRSATRRELRQGIGILWDVLTFWPRRYHPLAVRPYTERAVPEFQARIEHLVGKDRALLVSAHSQGTVIAFASLAPLQEHELRRIGLLTYGCPLTTLYGQVFPAYFGAAAIDQLRDQLATGAGRWHNLWRQTDPIGGPVLGRGDGDLDREVEDPATAPSSEDARQDEAREPLRRAWVELCGHSYFYREQAYRDSLRDLRDLLRDECGLLPRDDGHPGPPSAPGAATSKTHTASRSAAGTTSDAAPRSAAAATSDAASTNDAAGSTAAASTSDADEDRGTDVVETAPTEPQLESRS